VAKGVESILLNTNLSNFNYNALLESRSKQANGVSQVNFNATPAQYGGCGVENAEAGISGHSALLASGRAITDGGEALACSAPFITRWETTGENETVVIPIPATTAYNFIIDWGDCKEGVCADKNVQTFNVASSTVGMITHTYAEP
jgi:hypothetical protein